MLAQPLLIGFLEGLLSNIGVEHAAAVVALATIILYGRHLMSAGRMARNWMRVAIFSSALLLVALVLEIIPGINVGRAVALAQGVVQFFMDVIQL